MPSLRDRSKIAPRKSFGINDEIKYKKKKWSLDDKKRMLIYIKRYGVEHILKNTSLFYPDRTSEEINDFLEGIKKTEFPSYFADHYLSTKVKNPFEIWQETLNDLTKNISDYSNCISLVIEKIICTEKFDEFKSEEDPDWKLIYQYLLSALRQEPLPMLNGINAAIILKLLDDTIGSLSNLNIESQRKLVLEKLELFESIKDKEDIFQKLSTINKALLLGNPNEDKWKLPSCENIDNLILDVQKDTLYSLNPVNIPVKLLRPQPLAN